MSSWVKVICLLLLFTLLSCLYLDIRQEGEELFHKKCGGKIIKIVYGLYRAGPPLGYCEGACGGYQKPHIHWGCVITPGSPSHYCLGCGATFRLKNPFP